MRFCAIIIALVALFSVFSIGAEPDKWRGMVLDVSTPSDAIKKFGEPKSNKQDRIRVWQINKWISKIQKEKEFRILEYKDIEGFDKARLAFLDSKLVLIDLDFKEKIDPNALQNAYGVDFQPMVSGIDQAMNPDHFEHSQGRVYPKIYPSVYYVVGVSDVSFLCAMVGNASWGSTMRGMFDVPDANGFPGKVELIQIISRKALENRDGVEQLE